MIDYEDADPPVARITEFTALLDDIAPVRVAWLLGKARIQRELAWHRRWHVEIPVVGR
ncbi:MAG TPA: hypothetical protein VHC18_08935 [Amycolatopsis sp.]|nr:hypothetical protein [Amycolatopsis sp.]